MKIVRIKWRSLLNQSAFQELFNVPIRNTMSLLYGQFFEIKNRKTHTNTFWIGQCECGSSHKCCACRKIKDCLISKGCIEYLMQRCRNTTKEMVILISTLLLNNISPVEANMVESKEKRMRKIQSADGSLFFKPALSKTLGDAYGNTGYCCCCWTCIFKQISHTVITVLVYNMCRVEQSMWCAFIKEVHVNRQASRQPWHTDCIR